MKYILVLIIFTISLTASVIHADQDEYDDCLLKHLINAKIDLATQIMKQACRENLKDVTILDKKRKEYNECLLENLQGVESGEAATEIKGVCNRKHLQH